MKKKIIQWFAIKDELSRAKLYPGWTFQVWCQIQEEKIQKVLNEVMKKSTPSKAFQEYKKQSDALVMQHCKKDEVGTPVIVGDRYQFNEVGAAAIKEAIEKLNTKHKEAIDQYDKMIVEYRKWINDEEMDIDLKLLNEKNIPLQYFQDHPKESASFITNCLDLTTYQEVEEEQI